MRNGGSHRPEEAMSVEPRLDEQLPKSIGRYQVQGALGYGAMGAVYKGFDPLIKRTLAIKTIRLDIPRGSPEYKTFLERFYREARISGTLSHPSIVTLFDIGEDSNGTPYLAMEYVEGETIAHMIERGVRFQPEKVVGLLGQVASALDHAHARGIIHRDVKPSNLILFEEDRVKVSDFGIAKLAGAEMTQAGQLLGTPSYMSPEQAMGEPLDGRSDIFSLGVCAFEMLAGEQPFPGNNITSILYKLVHVDPVEPANLEMNGLIPRKWHEVFGRVLAKKPDQRYQTADEFVHDLEYCLGSSYAAPPPSQAPTMVQMAATEAMAVGLPGATDVTAEIPGARTAAPAPAPVPAASPAAPFPTADLRVDDAVETTAIPRVPTTAEASGASPAPTQMLDVPSASDQGPAPTVAMAHSELAADGATAPQETPAVEESPPETVVLATEELSEADTERLRKGVPPPSPRRLPVGWLVGAGALGVIGLGVVGVLLLRPGPAEQVPEPTPAPTTVAPEPPVALTEGVLHVESEPAGAVVSVDGEPRGTTPLEVTGLGAGAHEVRVERDGYEPHVESVTIAADAPRAELKLALKRVRKAPVKGFADIQSTPAGAVVTIDGTAAGLSPLAGVQLRPGDHRVEIVKQGYEPFSSTLVVVAGQRATLEARLKPVVAAPTPTPPPTPDLSRVFAENEVDKRPKKLSGEPSSYRPKLKPGETISVTLSWVVDEEGKVTDLRVLESGGQQLDEALTEAHRRWRYEPAVKNGAKVRVKLSRKYTYRAG